MKNMKDMKREFPSVDGMKSIYQAQLLTYMRLSDIKLGFLINSDLKRLADGPKSYVL